MNLNACEPIRNSYLQYDQHLGAIQWLPDGKTLAFEYSVNAKLPSISTIDSSVYTINVDGSELKLLAELKPGERLQSWSPDGKKLLLTSFIPLGFFSMDLNGKVGKINNIPVKESHVYYTSDSTHIIAETNKGISLIDSEGKLRLLSFQIDSNFLPITSFVQTKIPDRIFFSNFVYPTKSEAGKTIIQAFGKLDTATAQVKDVNIIRQYTITSNNMEDPEFKFIGWKDPETVLYFYSVLNGDKNAERTLYSHNVISGEVKVLATFPSDPLNLFSFIKSSNQVSPDASKVAFAYDDLSIVDIDGKNEKVILEDYRNILPKGESVAIQ